MGLPDYFADDVPTKLDADLSAHLGWVLTEADDLVGFAVVERQAELDRLLTVDANLGISRLALLRRGATSATAEVIRAELDKLAFLRSLDADTIDLSALPPGRRRFLAQVARRATARALARANVHRRYPILVATLAETAVEVLDELVQLFDHALASSTGPWPVTSWSAP